MRLSVRMSSRVRSRLAPRRSVQGLVSTVLTSRGRVTAKAV